jgi:hypothetical protein
MSFSQRVKLMKWIVPFFAMLLVGCAVPMPPSPLPTPTTVTGTLLPVETIQFGNVCEELETEYVVFFLTSEEEWDDVWSGLLGNPNLGYLGSDRDAIIEAVEQTNFQTHGLLFALRTCHSSSHFSITIARAVETSNEQLTVYVELRDPAPSHGVTAAETGYFHLARIPWSEEYADDLTVEAVAYTLLIGGDGRIIE